MQCVLNFLLGAEDTVAGIAQTGNDVSVVIQLFVAGSQVHLPEKKAQGGGTGLVGSRKSAMTSRAGAEKAGRT